MKFMFVLIALIVLAAGKGKKSVDISARAAPVMTPCGAAEEICGSTGGSPATECAKFGLTALGKDDFNQKIASRRASVTLVKAGTCFTVYRCAPEGTRLRSASGKDISHVTYCGDYGEEDCNMKCGEVTFPGAIAPEPESVPQPSAPQPSAPQPTEEQIERNVERRDNEEEAVIASAPVPPPPPSNPEVVEQPGGIIIEQPEQEVPNPFAVPPPVHCSPPEPREKQVIIRVKDHCKTNFDDMQRRLHRLSKQASRLLDRFSSWEAAEENCVEAKAKVFAPPKVAIASKPSGEVYVVKKASPASKEQTEVIENNAAAAASQEAQGEVIVNALGEKQNVPAAILEHPLQIKEKVMAPKGSVMGRIVTEDGFPLDGDDEYYKKRCLAEISNELACDPYARARELEIYNAKKEAKQRGITLTSKEEKHAYNGEFNLLASMMQGKPALVKELEARIAASEEAKTAAPSAGA